MELFLKLAGGILICLSSTLIGIYYSYKDSYRINDLCEMKKALIVLKSEIEYALNPLPDAFISISGRTSGNISGFFSDTAKRMEQRNGEPLYMIWQEQLDINFKKAYFIDEDLHTFSQLGKTLGYLDKPLQISSIQIAVTYIDDKNSELYELSAKNRKLYRSLGILGGLLITLIIL